YYDKEVDMDAIHTVADNYACDVITSVDKYLDILPKGVNKGSTLRALIQTLGIADEDVLVAGDTLNDLSLYEVGLKGVVVGQAEPALIKQTAELSQVYQAGEPGAGGILEAIAHFETLKKYYPNPKGKKPASRKKSSN